MKISTKGRYALCVMLDLAIYDTGEYISLKIIAKRLNFSGKYLEQIIGILTKAGFVKSVRGSSGGYRLAKKPQDYTVGDILRLTEGSLSPVSCMEEDAEHCPKIESCLNLAVWAKLNDAINRVVDSITLADLVEHSESIGDFYSI